MNKDKTALSSRRFAQAARDVQIHTGDTNPYLKKLLPTIQYSDFTSALFACSILTDCISIGT